MFSLRFAAVPFALLLVSTMTVSAAANESINDLRKQQQKNQALIDNARDEQKKIEAELSKLGSDAKSAGDQLKRTTLELKRAEHGVTIQKGKVRRAGEDLNNIAGAIDVSVRSIDEQQKRLRSRSRALFSMAITAENEELMKPGEAAGIEIRLSILEKAALTDAALVRATRTRKLQLLDEKNSQEILLAQLAKEEERLVSIEAEVTRKKHEVQQLKNRIARKTIDTKKALENTKRMIASTIQIMIKTQARLKALEKKYAALKGKFPRPVDGDFYQPQELQHMDGIYISAKNGSSVKTIQAGEVLSIQELRGVGITVVVGHGDNYTSSYSNLSAVHVKEGQALTDRQVIGKSGRSPYGEMIFFSIFHNQSPVNARSKLY